jgi:23S rRNA (adenine2503-C2)-methyltransferase
VRWCSATPDAAVGGNLDAFVAAVTAPPLLGRSLDDLRSFAVASGQPAFRGKQLHDALYGRARVGSLAEATQLPAAFREALAARSVGWGRSTIHSKAISADGTLKLLLRLHDGAVVECVGIPARKAARSPRGGGVDTSAFARARGSRGGDGCATGAPPSLASSERLTVCLSSQVGCAMGCTFCATGKQGGGRRNLLPHEIVDQALHIGEQMQHSGDTGFRRVDNAVFMGQGEAFMNLKNVLVARARLNDSLDIGARSITLSTVGVPKTLERLAEAFATPAVDSPAASSAGIPAAGGFASGESEKEKRVARAAKSAWQSTLTVSLHAPNQELREKLVPTARTYPLNVLLRDCLSFYRKTGRRVSFAYVLISGVNDEVAHAAELAALLKAHALERGHVNLIPYNPIGVGAVDGGAADGGANAAGANTNVDYLRFTRPSGARLVAFRDVLERAGLNATVRSTRGDEHSAACGQLSNSVNAVAKPPSRRKALAAATADSTMGPEREVTISLV